MQEHSKDPFVLMHTCSQGEYKLHSSWSGEKEWNGLKAHGSLNVKEFWNLLILTNACDIVIIQDKTRWAGTQFITFYYGTKVTATCYVAALTDGWEFRVQEKLKS